MTDAQFERIKKGLNFHSEGGVYNLCTLTETALREIIEDAVKFYEKQQKIDALHIMELQKQNGELTDELTLTNNECKKMREELKQRIRENQKLCEQIEKGKVVEHFEAYGQCRDSRRIAELESQIEKMKCCGNCKHFDFNEPNYCHKGVYRERQYVCGEWCFGN